MAAAKSGKFKELLKSSKLSAKILEIFFEASYEKSAKLTTSFEEAVILLAKKLLVILLRLRLVFVRSI